MNRIIHKKKGWIYGLVIIFLILAASLSLFLYKKAGNGGNKGIVLEIEETIEPPALTYYLQRDERWKDDRLGDSSFTMGSSGCLVTCLASIFNLYGREVTPGELNESFGKAGVYNSSGDVIWGKITAAYPEVNAVVPQEVEPEKLAEALKNGQYPLVKVKYLGKGYWHWVLLVGSDERGYLCMDPLYDKKKARPLNDHGGKVYSYRLVVKK